MWEQYKKTFLRMQILIGVVVLAIYLLLGRQLPLAGMFFMTMQVGNVLGVLWGARLRNKRVRSPLGLA